MGPKVSRDLQPASPRASVPHPLTLLPALRDDTSVPCPLVSRRRDWVLGGKVAFCFLHGRWLFSLAVTLNFPGA